MSRLPRPIRRGREDLPLVRLLPNAVTLAAVCAGLTAIRLAVTGRLELAAALIVLAAILDGIDGRLARLTGSESAIGAELDSLADVLNFGAAPAVVLYFAGSGTAGGGIWIAFLFYVICCALRLARFNVGSRTGEGGDKRYFTGVPAPAGAMLALLPLFLSFALPQRAALPEPAIGLHMLAIGGLMVSRLPTCSLASVTIRAEAARFALAGMVAFAAALLIWPWATLSVGVILYLLVLVAGLTRYKPAGPEEGDMPDGT
jgi:CDP-diacylglycerol--serine O-phosphatidyltransferase